MAPACGGDDDETAETGGATDAAGTSGAVATTPATDAPGTTGGATATSAGGATTGSVGGSDTTGGGDTATTGGGTSGGAVAGICGSTEEELVAAAQEEGSVTFYGAATENILQVAAEAFGEEYGIETQFIRLGSSDLEQRYNAEAEADSIVADVAIQSDTGISDVNFFENGVEQGWMVPLEEAGIPGFPWDFPADDWLRGSRAVLHIQPWLIGYNTDLVDDPPTDWPDVLDPKYQNQILLPDPSASGAYAFVWAAVLNEYGEEFFADLAAQEPRLFDSGVPATEALAAGEGALQFPAVGGQIADPQSRGAPVDIVVPNVTSGVEMSIGLTNPELAEHPCAAQLLTAWLMQEEGNAVFSDFPAVFSVYNPEGLPSGYVSPSEELAAQSDTINELLGVG